MPNTAIDQVLAETHISGLDIPGAVLRMGNNPKLYMRIIHSFVANMPGNLVDLATGSITMEALEHYGIKIHGAKGSCYGIGATAVGDLAKELEIAAKHGDIEYCMSNNEGFITSTLELIEELKALEERVEALETGATGKPQADKPDAAKLKSLLTATQEFNINAINELVEELNNTLYAQGGEVIAKIKEASDAYDYQTIEETITAFLEGY
ncbi:MAG: hypothetical protein FWD27_07590 [Coriobacteriia bacterium]|nr:hypothetical protein [Coriobacteriia bacterium]